MPIATDKIWLGQIHVMSQQDHSLHYVLRVLKHDSAVKWVLDLSCYFIIKIKYGRGKHTLIKLGFNERNEAFNFNVALFDHEKYICREHKKEYDNSATIEESQIDIHPTINHRLKGVAGKEGWHGGAVGEGGEAVEGEGVEEHKVESLGG
ncbi:adaptin ear-binding coat-associated protein 1/2 [Spatholobus suberectus]|nr:adaptin ear-binding coat-associated protein 1/2 [Spatholobus suberectus]